MVPEVCDISKHFKSAFRTTELYARLTLPARDAAAITGWSRTDAVTRRKARSSAAGRQ